MSPGHCSRLIFHLNLDGQKGFVTTCATCSPLDYISGIYVVHVQHYPHPERRIHYWDWDTHLQSVPTCSFTVGPRYYLNTLSSKYFIAIEKGCGDSVTDSGGPCP